MALLFLLWGKEDAVLLNPSHACPRSYLGVLNTTWELGRGLVAYSGQPVLLGGTNSTNVVAGERQSLGGRPRFHCVSASSQLAAALLRALCQLIC